MTSEPDYYRLLEVAPNATQQEIERAYRRLARRFHPDVNPAQDAHDRMAAINQAYQTLRDPASRARYDARRARRSQWSRQAPLHGVRQGLEARWQHALLKQQAAWRAQWARWLPDLIHRAGRAYEAYGYRVLQTLPRDPWIADLLLWRHGKHALARLHVWPRITPAHIQALLDELNTTSQVTGAYVTTGRFTPAARRLAEDHRMPCYDGEAFAAVWRRVAQSEDS